MRRHFRVGTLCAGRSIALCDGTRATGHAPACGEGGAVKLHVIAAAAFAASLATATAALAGELPGATPVALYVSLPGTHEEQIDGLLRAQETPGAPLYQHYLTPAQYGAYFGAQPTALRRAVTALRAAGFTIDEVMANRRDLQVHAPAATVARYFGTPFDLRSTNGRAFFAARSAPIVPAALGGASVYGFDSFERRHPHHRAVPAVRIGGAQGWGPPDIQSTYDLTPIYGTSTGKGITVADATIGFARASDFTAFTTAFSLGAKLVNVPVGGGIPQDTNGESTLDVEWIAAIAPDVTVDQVSPPNASDQSFDAMYSHIVNDMSTVHLVTTSWGICEQEMGSDLKLEEGLFAQASTEGQWWLSAAGDDGSDDCQNGIQSVDFPGSSPFLVSAGGTEVTPLSTTGGKYGGWKSEVTWDVVGDGAGGGGKSTLFAKPRFQNALTPADHVRDVPDVALMSDDFDHNGGYVVAFEGVWQNGWGGTSFAAPMWAGFLALAEQKHHGTITKPLVRLYALANTAKYGTYFHDVASGCNGFHKVQGYCAGHGYDLATGLGSFIGAGLEAAY
jgi:subtilase family serine protease